MILQPRSGDHPGVGPLALAVITAIGPVGADRPAEAPTPPAAAVNAVEPGPDRRALFAGGGVLVGGGALLATIPWAGIERGDDEMWRSAQVLTGVGAGLVAAGVTLLAVVGGRSRIEAQGLEDARRSPAERWAARDRKLRRKTTAGLVLTGIAFNLTTVPWIALSAASWARPPQSDGCVCDAIPVHALSLTGAGALVGTLGIGMAIGHGVAWAKHRRHRANALAGKVRFVPNAGGLQLRF